MDKHAKSLLDKIEKEHITPNPKIYFGIKNLLFWTLCVISILMVLAVTGITIIRIVAFRKYQFGLMDVPIPQWLLIIRTILPIVWLLILIGMIILIPYSIRHTKHGYKYPVSVLLSIIFVTMLFASIGVNIRGISGMLEERFTERGFMPSLDKVDKLVWNDPKNGHLVGVIKSMSSKEIILISEIASRPNKDSARDPSSVSTLSREMNRKMNKKKNRETNRKMQEPFFQEDIFELDEYDNDRLIIWTVDIRKAIIHPLLEGSIKEGSLIKLEGTLQADKHFEAQKILPDRRFTKEMREEFCDKNINRFGTIEACNSFIKETSPKKPPRRKRFPSPRNGAKNKGGKTNDEK